MCGEYQCISEREVTTRKPRICEWCGQRIEAGTRATNRVYKFDGDFHNNYCHPECFTAMSKADHHELCEGWSPGDWQRGRAEPA